MKLQLKRSLRLSNGAAQAPSAEQMSFGEIAVNYSDTDPSIFLKDSNNVIRKLAISALPDTSSSSSQSGTLDDRYLRLNGGTLSGSLSGVEFIGGVARVSDNAPASGTASELWFNSSNGRLYIRYGGQWVDASPDSFTMGTDFYSKTQADAAISTAVAALENGQVAANASAVTALENGQVATNTSAIAGLTTDIAAEESARLAAEADKMDVAGGTFTGPVSFNEDVIVKGGAGGSGEITLNCEMNSHGVKLKGPAHSAGASYTLTLPTSTGNSGEVLTTDGSGVMSWEEVVGNEISASAPTSPSQGALWTDTSEDPSAPILKTWNGSAWVAVGSAAASEFAPVIDSVTLTENDTTGDRFTSQTFDVDITMLVEGAPHSQKGLKGEVTAEFGIYPATEPVSSNALTTFPNNDRTYSSQDWPNKGTAAVYATDNLGRGKWYFLRGSGDTLSLHEYEPGSSYNSSQIASYNGYFGAFQHGVYIPNPGPYQYIYTASSRKDNSVHVKAFRRPTNGGGDWVYYNPGYEMSPPVYDEQYNVWWSAMHSGNTLYIKKGTTHLSQDLGDINRSSTSGSSSGIIVLGDNRVVVTRRHNSTGYIYCDVYQRDAANLTYLGLGTIQYSNSSVDYIGYAGGYFIASAEGNTKRSSDGTTWNSITIDDDFTVKHIEYNTSTGNIEAYGVDNANDKMEMWTSNNGGVTWVQAFEYSVSNSQRGEHVQIAGSKVMWYGYRSSNYQEHFFPRNEQTLTLSGTGADYSSFNVNDVIRPEGSTATDEQGKIISISGADIQVESDYIYQAGDKIEAVYPINSSVSTRYLVIDATGAVSGTVGSDPGYVSVGPNTSQTLTFPATFDTGNAPDDELAAGTTIKVSAQATNSEGSSEFGPSNIVTPS